MHSFKHAGVLGIAALFIYGAEGFQPPLFAGAEVVLAVAGRNMHNPHPGVHGNEICPDNGVFFMRQRVIVFQPHQIRPGYFAGLGTIQFGIFQKFFGQFFGYDIVFAGFFVFQNGVIFGIGNGGRHIGGNGPGRGGPDGQADGFGIVQIAKHFFFRIHQFKPQVNRGGFYIFIFRFGVGQCRFAVRTPGNGFLPFIDISFFNQIQKYADGNAFVTGRHRKIGVIPVALYAQAFKTLALQVNKFSGKFARFFAKSGHIGNVFFILFQFF